MTFESGEYSQRNDFSSQPWSLLELKINKKGNPLVLFAPNDAVAVRAVRAGMRRMLSQE